MTGLLRKELRELRPFALLGVFLFLLDMGEWLTEQLDMQPLAVNFGDSNEVLAVMLFFMAVAAGTGLLVREIDDRTLAFLDGLPVARLRIFGAKITVAMLVLLLYPACHLLMLAAQHMVSRQSLDHAVHAGLLWESAALICVLTGVGLALGLLLGFLRNLCWLTLGLVAMTLMTMTRIWPELSVLNPLQLLEPRLVGVQWRVSTANLSTQLGLLVVCALLSLFIFLSASNGRARKLQLWMSRPLVSAAVTLATIITALGALALIGYVSSRSADKPAVVAGAPAVEFAASPAISARTERYSFSYRAQQAEQAGLLLADADRVFADVAAILGAANGPRIDVDLTGSLQNTDGTAFHDRIRMHLGRRPAATLAHETAHVLARRLAGGELERELSKMSAFNEGLATWIQNSLSGKSGLTDDGRFQAAVVSRRHLVTPAELTDMEAFARHADINLRYPLGAALVDSLVTRYGRDAISKLLLALGDPDFPRDLAGMELWYAAFQAAGFDLALVFDDYSRHVKAWESEFAGRIAELPRPRGSLVYGEGKTGVDVRWEGKLPAGWSAVMRFRPQENSPLDQYWMVRVDAQFVAWIPAAAVINEQLCFQPGVSTQDAAIFEAWVCLPVEPPGR